MCHRVLHRSQRARANQVSEEQRHSEPRSSNTMGSSTKVLTIQAGRRSAVSHESTTHHFNAAES